MVLSLAERFLIVPDKARSTHDYRKGSSKLMGQGAGDIALQVINSLLELFSQDILFSFLNGNCFEQPVPGERLGEVVVSS